MTTPSLFSIPKSLLLVFVVFLSGCTVTGALKPAPFKIPSARYAAIVVNAKTGKVLHETRPDAIRFPASLTKMMTMYMVFEAMQRGRVTKSTQIPISAKAAARPASKLWLKAGTSISVDTALDALAVKSANDVAYAVAEYFGGTEAGFARAMTSKARALGMSSTTFRNASGLPDRRQVTTARDMARLSILLHKRFPQHVHYFNQRSFVFRGKTIRGHNKVLGQLRGANGLKTGYTRASGFNLATSAKTSQGLVVGVILGENSGRSRNRHMVQLINRYGHRSN